MGAFFGTAPWYVSHRPKWPAQAIDVIRDRFLPTAAGRVLDLGCGPGTLGVAFAALEYEVVGVDCEPEMIETARTLVPRAEWHCAAAEEIAFADATFDLAVLGRSFHWMDRGEVVRSLARWLRPTGGLAILSDPCADAPENAWLDVVEEVVDRWNPWEPTEGDSSSDLEIIAGCPDFPFVEEIHVPVTRHWTIDDVIGLTRSLSKTLPCRQRGEENAFIAELRSALHRFGEPLEEKVDVTILLAGRSRRNQAGG